MLTKIKHNITNKQTKKLPTRYVPQWMLWWNFLLSYCLIIFGPIIDLIISMPAEIDYPRSEFCWSIVLGVAHSWLTILSFSDIYTKEAYLERNFRVICITARYCQGFALSECIMIALHVWYLHYSWPFYYKTLRNYYGWLMFGRDYQSEYKTFQQHQYNDDYISNNYYYISIISDKLDTDCLALIIAQCFRFSIVFNKCCLAAAIRRETHERNVRVGRKYFHNMNVPESCQIFQKRLFLN